MTTEREYNGWSNYETWCVNVWLENNEVIYSHWRERARQCAQFAPGSKSVGHENQAEQDAVALILAVQLENEFHELDSLQSSDVYSDLLRAAVSEVDWFEIARNLLADCFPVAALAPATKPLLSNGPQFELGRIVGTPPALAMVSQDEIAAALDRHLRGDWGSVCPADGLENDRALKAGGRLLSIYDAANQTRFWIITEADRSVTTVLLPSDY